MSLKVRIERVAPEGEGIGKSPGSDKIVFVPNSLPGDVVEAEVSQEKPRYLRANIRSIIEPSPMRVSPRCPIHFRPGMKDFCGGCDWQHASYEAQLRLKRDVVLDSIKHIAKLQAPVLDTLASPQPWRYRNKVQVPFQAAGQGFKAGFYVPGSHCVVEFEDCVVQPEFSVAIVQTVKALAREYGWKAYDEERDQGWLRHLYLRTNSAGEAVVVFVTRTRSFPKERETVLEMAKRHPKVISLWQNVQEERTSVILGEHWRRLAGRERMTEKIGSQVLQFSPGAFLQVNTPAAEVLYRATEDSLLEGGFKPGLVLDLYSGVGAIALWLASKVGRVIGVEESPQAVEDAYGNARRLGLRNVSFARGRVEYSLRRMRGLDAPRPWAVVLDPPRSGCDIGVLRFFATRRMERIVYVSCNPATFARDARILADSGYTLEKIQPVDLFPQTSHVELVARFKPS